MARISFGKNLKVLFAEARKEALEKSEPMCGASHITAEAIAHLPYLLRRHFELSGQIGKPIPALVDVDWSETELTMKEGAQPKLMTTELFICPHPLTRAMYMKVHGMPFQGLDLYQNAKGCMLGRLFGCLEIIHAEGDEMDVSELITLFAEFSLINSLFLMPGLDFEELDEHHLKLVLRVHGHIVSGVFGFDDEGWLRTFSTNDRYKADKKGTYVKTPFLTRVIDYRASDLGMLPHKISVCWVLDGKEFEYFSGTVGDIAICVK